ncbi:MAG: hypothetical protein ACE5JD_03280 [Candidatus Methylomirabilia bacterium]
MRSRAVVLILILGLLVAPWPAEAQAAVSIMPLLIVLGGPGAAGHVVTVGQFLV